MQIKTQKPCPHSDLHFQRAPQLLLSPFVPENLPPPSSPAPLLLPLPSSPEGRQGSRGARGGAVFRAQAQLLKLSTALYRPGAARWWGFGSQCGGLCCPDHVITSCLSPSPRPSCWAASVLTPSRELAVKTAPPPGLGWVQSHTQAVSLGSSHVPLRLACWAQRAQDLHRRP